MCQDRVSFTRRIIHKNFNIFFFLNLFKVFPLFLLISSIPGDILSNSILQTLVSRNVSTDCNAEKYIIHVLHSDGKRVEKFVYFLAYLALFYYLLLFLEFVFLFACVSNCHQTSNIFIVWVLIILQNWI